MTIEPRADAPWWWQVDDEDAVYSGTAPTEAEAWRQAHAAMDRASPVMVARAEGVAAGLDAMRARAEAAEQRAEALAAELAQARADRTLMAGLWLITVPPRELPALLPTDQGDRDRLAAALDAVDRQTGAEALTAAGRTVIARIVAETGGGAR